MNYLFFINLQLFKIFNFFDQPITIFNQSNFNLQIIFQVHIGCAIQVQVIRPIIDDNANPIQNLDL